MEGSSAIYVLQQQLHMTIDPMSPEMGDLRRHSTTRPNSSGTKPCPDAIIDLNFFDSRFPPRLLLIKFRDDCSQGSQSAYVGSSDLSTLTSGTRRIEPMISRVYAHCLVVAQASV